MAGATFKVQLKDTPRKDGKHAIRIRITKDRKHAYYTTGINIKLADWNPKGDKNNNWVRSSDKQYKVYNENLATTLNELWELSRDHIHLSATQLKDNYEAPAESEAPKKGLMAFWQEYIDRKRKIGKEGAATNFADNRKYIIAFAGPNPPESYLLTPQFTHDFLAWMRSENKATGKKPYSPSTCKGAIGKLNTIYKAAVLEGWVQQAGDPFGVVDITVPSQKRQRPTVEQVQALMQLELRPGTRDYNALTCFVLQFFLHGARVAEALSLEWSQVSDDRVVYLPQKKATKNKSIPMSPGLRWALDRCDRSTDFVLPYLQRAETASPAAYYQNIKRHVSQVGKGLKAIGKMITLPYRLTSHMARHAFADAALASVSDMRVLQEMLGHSSVQTTERYISDLKGDKLDQASKLVYGGFSFTGKTEENK